MLRNKVHQFFFIILVINLPFIPFSSAQCDKELLKYADKHLPYKDRGNRCEGFYNPYTSTYFSLVHFSNGPFLYKGESKEIITVINSIKENSDIHIRAVGKKRDLNYRMDANLRNGDTLKWPVDEVLTQDRATKDYREVGIFGFTGTDINPVYWPIKARSNYIQLPSNPTDFYIQLRATQAMSEVSWRLVNTSISGKQKNEFFAGDLIDIRIETDVEFSTGIYTLTVDALNTRGESIPTKIFRIHL